MISPEKKLEGGSEDFSQEWVCRSSIEASMQELGAESLPRGLPRKLKNSLKRTITCLSSLLEKKNTLGRTQLPAWVSRKSAGKDTNSLKLWGSHLRWAALCPVAWSIVFSGRIPLQQTTPPIVEEVKELHDRIVDIVYSKVKRLSNILYIEREPRIEYSIKSEQHRKIIEVILKPDIYILWKTRANPINLVVEVTTRQKTHIPIEWLTAYLLGVYIHNMKPSFLILVTLGEASLEVSSLALTTYLVKKLKKLIEYGADRELTMSLCYNCDLRTLCPSPLV